VAVFRQTCQLLIIDELGFVPLSKTGALLDRITHHVNILEMNGDSYRLAQSRARKSTASAVRSLRLNGHQIAELHREGE
jgi:DNA replication protein DnaC